MVEVYAGPEESPLAWARFDLLQQHMLLSYCIHYARRGARMPVRIGKNKEDPGRRLLLGAAHDGVVVKMLTAMAL